MVTVREQMDRLLVPAKPLPFHPEQMSSSPSLLRSIHGPLTRYPGPWPGLQHSHHQAPSNEATHEPNLQAEVAIRPGGLPIRYQQEGVGHDADQGERDEGEPQAASTLSSTHV